jgi:ubiquinone/menaquinone biosynthesis C-methylase UbiE/uncharacterized protein YbaR (Trm112 family)
MHPSFSRLFVHPQGHEPLAFFGGTEEGGDHLRYAYRPGGERWTNGYLWAEDTHDLYPVIDGIPVFVLPRDQTWRDATEELRRERWIEKNWEKAGKGLEEESVLTEFSKRMAESGGLILDVGSGAQGGFVPKILHLNPQATILMDDLGLCVLEEWRIFLKGKDITNTSFALFDAKEMPLKPDSIDAIGDIWGFANMSDSAKAIEEGYRVLKPGGRLFSLNCIMEGDDFMKLPEEFRTKWYKTNPPFYDGFFEAFKKAGFDVVSHELFVERELSPDEGDLPGEANKHGVRLHVIEYCTEAIK